MATPTPITAFTPVFKPLTQITPFTFRDGYTFLEMYSELRQYLVKLLGPEIDAKLTLIYTETQAMVNALAEDVNASKDAWQGLFDEFMANVIVELEGLNDQAVANLVNDAGSNIRVALDSLYATRGDVALLRGEVEGRLSAESLNLNYASKATQSTVEGGRLSESVVNDKLDTYRYGTRNALLGLGAGALNDGETSTVTSNGGYGLVAVGADALRDNVRGWNNVAVGYAAMADNVDGYNNVAVGDAALERNRGGIGDTGTSNIAPGSRNVGVGSYALRYNTVGHANVGIGRNAAHTNVTGAYNTAVGTNAYSGQFSNGVGNSKSANDNTMIGYNAGFATNANNNTALGAHALYLNTTGPENTALGHSAGYGINGGSYNVAIGNRAMLAPNTGGSNTAVGVSSLSNATSGNRNTGVGTGSLNMLSDGSSNVAVGYNAGWLPPEDAFGVNSTVSLGAESLARHTGSVAIGYQTTTTTLDQVAVGARHLELLEHGVVGSPSAGALRVYVMVESGKTNLKIKFPNGEVKTIMGES